MVRWFYIFNFVIVFYILGNKCDLYDREVVSEEEGVNLAKENNAIFLLTSAKDGVGLTNIVDTIIDNCIKTYGEPETWKFENSDLSTQLISDNIVKEQSGCCK